MSSVVLLSSGLDSTVNLYEALSRNDKVLTCLTFDYGQRAAKKEAQNATLICKKLNVAHQIVDLKWFSSFTSTSLVSESMTVPTDVQIDDLMDSKKSAKAVWVPNRNGIFINIAAGYAEGLSADEVVVGFNREEAATFPDNSQEYLEALNRAFEYSTSNKIKVRCYTTELDKVQIAKRAKELKVDLNLVWPCYEGREEICQKCESCLRYIRAIRALA